MLVSLSSEHRLTIVHNTVKGSCCDVFVVEKLFSRSRTYVHDPLIVGPLLHSLTENDLELDIWPIDWPLITNLTPKINSPGKHYLIKRCHTLFIWMISHPEANPEPIAAILHLCKLQEFPKVAALATKLNTNYRPIWLPQYKKTIHFSRQLGSLCMEQIVVATGLLEYVCPVFQTILPIYL